MSGGGRIFGFRDFVARRVGRIFLGLAAAIAIAGGGYAFVLDEGPMSRRDLEPILSEVLAGPLPELVRGESGHVLSGDLAIWYESLAPAEEEHGTILLMIGIADDSFGWPPRFVEALLARGFRVVRLDHRGTGLSQRDIGEAPFTLRDMAGDAIAVLDALGVARAHLVGISMGGMIAQELAIAHPDRAASLVSINSTGDIFDPELPGISRVVQAQLAFEELKHMMRGGERSLVQMRLAQTHILAGGAAVVTDVRTLAESALYKARHRGGPNYRAMLAHMRAIGRSGSRHAALARLSLPTLVVHGIDDPLLPLAHGKKTARSIPGAQTLFLDDMGHEIPDEHAGTIADAIRALARDEDVEGPDNGTSLR